MQLTLEIGIINLTHYFVSVRFSSLDFIVFSLHLAWTQDALAKKPNQSKLFIIVRVWASERARDRASVVHVTEFYWNRFRFVLAPADIYRLGQSFVLFVVVECLLLHLLYRRIVLVIEHSLVPKMLRTVCWFGKCSTATFWCCCFLNHDKTFNEQ